MFCSLNHLDFFDAVLPKIATSLFEFDDCMYSWAGEGIICKTERRNEVLKLDTNGFSPIPIAFDADVCKCSG